MLDRLRVWALAPAALVLAGCPATVAFTGGVEGPRLRGETRIDISTTEGEAVLPGELVVERRIGGDR